MMPIEGANLEQLLERAIQINTLILEEMHEDRKQSREQQSTATTNNLVDSSS